MDPITRLDLLGPETDPSALDGEPTEAELAELEAAIAGRLPGLGEFFARGPR